MQSIDEHLFKLQDLLKTQNSIINKRIKEKQFQKHQNQAEIDYVMEKYQLVRKYVVNILLKKLNNISGNKRYTFSFWDNSTYENAKDIRAYFKIIITNNASKRVNFIIVSFTLKEFIIREKEANSDDEINLIEIKIPAERFSKSSMRIILFNYFEKIILKDTLPRYSPTINSEF